jgi:hypothetical protein
MDLTSSKQKKMLVQQANMRVRSATIDDLHRISPGNGPIILSIGNRPISSTNLGDFHYHDSQKVSTLTPEKGFIDPRKTNRFVLSNQGLELHHRCDMHVNRGWISRKKNYHSLVVPNKQTSENISIKRK